jgi:hypothetical protein
MKTTSESLKPTFILNRSGHLLDAIGKDFPLALIKSDPRTALITLAFMFSNNDPMRCDNFGLAATQLALFAAAPHAGITSTVYEQLKTTVESYRDYCRQLQATEQDTEGYEDMVQLLSFILDEASAENEKQSIEPSVRPSKIESSPFDQADGFR